MGGAIKEAVETVARAGQKRFYGSTIAARVGTSEAAAQRELLRLVKEDLLELRFELLCPDTGVPIRTFRSLEEIPFDEEIDDERCSAPFVIDRTDVVVVFEPSRRLLFEMIVPRGKAPAQRRWAAKAFHWTGPLTRWLRSMGRSGKRASS
jgi:hypothetical protein